MKHYDRMIAFNKLGPCGPSLYVLDEYLQKNPGATIRGAAKELKWGPTRVQRLKSFLRIYSKTTEYPELTRIRTVHTID